jgi:hypothetical protein
MDQRCTRLSNLNSFIMRDFCSLTKTMRMCMHMSDKCGAKLGPGMTQNTKHSESPWIWLFHEQSCTPGSQPDCHLRKPWPLIASYTTFTMSSPVGIIISGRPVITEPSSVISPTQSAFQIPSQPSFSHIVVFLLPGVALPDGTAAAVYAQLPGTTEFKLLGAIANEKPSAIFKVNTKPGGPVGGGLGSDDAMVDEGVSVDAANGNSAPLALGISVEPAQQVAAAIEQNKTHGAAVSATTGAIQGNELVVRGQKTVETKVLAQRIIKNCYDFLTSWGTGDTVPLKAFQAWWTKFEGKIERDPGFLERTDGG